MWKKKKKKKKVDSCTKAIILEYFERKKVRLVKVEVTQSCPTLWDPMDYTAHGILHSRVTTGISGFLLCWPRKVQSSIRVARESWGVLSSYCRAKATSSSLVFRTQ